MISSGGEAYSMKEKQEILQSFVAEMKKILGQPFPKAGGPGAAPWEPTDKHYLSGYLFAVFRSGELENPIKGVSIG